MSKSLLVTGAAGFIGANFVHYWAQAYPQDTVRNSHYCHRLRRARPLSRTPNLTRLQPTCRCH